MHFIVDIIVNLLKHLQNKEYDKKQPDHILSAKTTYPINSYFNSFHIYFFVLVAFRMILNIFMFISVSLVRWLYAFIYLWLFFYDLPFTIAQREHCSGSDFYSKNANAASKRHTKHSITHSHWGCEIARADTHNIMSNRPAKSNRREGGKKTAAIAAGAMPTAEQMYMKRRDGCEYAVIHKLAVSVFVTKSNSYYFKS